MNDDFSLQPQNSIKFPEALVFGETDVPEKRLIFINDLFNVFNLAGLTPLESFY